MIHILVSSGPLPTAVFICGLAGIVLSALALLTISLVALLRCRSEDMAETVRALAALWAAHRDGPE